MSRLIDEKKLREDIDNIVIKEMKAHLGEDECGDTLLSVTTKIIKCIEQQPTAFDVDKVVEQLENYKMWKELLIYDLDFRERQIIKKAIDIIKAGGIDQ